MKKWGVRAIPQLQCPAWFQMEVNRPGGGGWMIVQSWGRFLGTGSFLLDNKGMKFAFPEVLNVRKTFMGALTTGLLISGSVWADAPCIKAPAPVHQLSKSVQAVLSKQNRNPALGALKIMATIYQGCDVLEKPIYNWDAGKGLPSIVKYEKEPLHNYLAIRRAIPTQVTQEQIINNHYYLRDRKPAGPQCVNVADAPPVFYLGGGFDKEKIEKTNSIDVLTKRTLKGFAVHRGIDCANFVSAALASQGMRVQPLDLKKNPPVDRYRSYVTYSGDYMKAGVDLSENAAVKCLKPVELSKSDTMKSGDVLVIQGHMMMIESAGPDPFGLQKIKGFMGKPLLQKASDCLELDKHLRPEHMDFTTIQSMAYGDVGVARISGARFFRKYLTYFPALRELAKKSCLAKFSGPAEKKSATVQSGGAPIMNLIRHVGDSVSGCTDPQKPKIEGSECVAGCFPPEQESVK